MDKRRIISKSQYLRGLQCPKALWLSRHRPDLKPEISPVQQHLFDSGHEVGRLAQTYFNGGVEIVAKHDKFGESIRPTVMIAAQKPLAVFEAAACSPDGAYARIDILKKCGLYDKWDLIEVKSTTSVKDYHIDDMALQRYAFSGAGNCIGKSMLMHVDKLYVRNGSLDLRQLFHLEDCTADVKARMAGVRENLVRLKTVLNRPDEPDITIGSRCTSPFACDFIPYCWQHVPVYSVYDIFGGNKLEKLLSKAILDVADIPDDFDVTPRQAIDIDTFKQNRIHADHAAIARFLNGLVYPLYFLDYETVMPAVPLFDNARPYQQIPFQFSLHCQGEKGGPVDHTGFLYTDSTDPRPQFVKALVERCGKRGSVVVYNQPFEAGVNGSLTAVFPEHAEALRAINDRMVDLLVPFRSRFLYHPAMQGSASLKSVLPAFVPDQGYEGMPIADGGTASLMYLKVLRNEVSDEKKRLIYKHLWEYCRLDTLAEVRLLEVLYKIHEAT